MLLPPSAILPIAVLPWQLAELQQKPSAHATTGMLYASEMRQMVGAYFNPFPLLRSHLTCIPDFCVGSWKFRPVRHWLRLLGRLQ